MIPLRLVCINTGDGQTRGSLDDESDKQSVSRRDRRPDLIFERGDSFALPEILRRSRRMQSNTIVRDVASTEKLMGNNNNLNNNGSPGADIMFQMEDDSLTQLGSVFQSAYQSIVGGSAQVRGEINLFFFFFLTKYTIRWYRVSRCLETRFSDTIVAI